MPPRQVIATVGSDKRHRLTGQPSDGGGQKLQRGGICPVQVIEKDGGRLGTPDCHQRTAHGFDEGRQVTVRGVIPLRQEVGQMGGQWTNLPQAVRDSAQVVRSAETIGP